VPLEPWHECQGARTSEWIIEVRRPARDERRSGRSGENRTRVSRSDNPRPFGPTNGQVTGRVLPPVLPTELRIFLKADGCSRVAMRSRNLTRARWATTWKMLPGPAGFAPASRCRPPARSGPRRALGFVQRHRALSNTAELRNPVARGLAHARLLLNRPATESEEPARVELAT
jgi:hypothetical protein